jgi:O-antigen ligase
VKHLYETDVRERLRAIDVSRVHNIFLLVAAEMGLPGLILFLSYVMVVGKLGWWKILRAREERTRLILLGLFFGFLGRLIHDAVHTGSLSANIVLWVYPSIFVAREEKGQDD